MIRWAGATKNRDGTIGRADAAPPLLALEGISKAYPGVCANDAVDLDIRAGEIHALLGENGAGKSTLVKIIYGVVRADAGGMRWQGRPVLIRNPAEARALGIGMVFQHFNLFETLTVAENISLGLDSGHDVRELAGEIEEVSARYGLPVNPRRHVHALSVAERQRVEIIRCLLQKPQLLILDEPTSVLTPQEAEKLFETLRTLAGEGCSILYISHKLDEIRVLCDRATVMRNGRVSGQCIPSEETALGLAEMMIGSELPHCARAPRSGEHAVVLEINGLSMTSPDPHGASLEDISLTLEAGEIVGIAGVTGNGQKELLAVLNGEVPCPDAGAITLFGRPIGAIGPGERRARGLAFVPEERLGRGAVPDMSLADNALLTGYHHGMVEGGLIARGKLRAFAEKVRTAFRVVAPDVDARAATLSGGNLQKFIIGREILLSPKVLVLGHPTWGVDVGAASVIHQALADLAAGGCAILLVSEDLDELFEICDRVAVIAKGRLSPALPVADTDVGQIGLWMSGGFIAGAGVKGEAAHAHQA